MVRKSLLYQNPLIYTLILKLIHGTNFSKRYHYLANFVKKGDTVLEPACGPAILADFLPKGSFYYGFDTNQEFINYALAKKLKVHLGNVLEISNYRKVDFVIACDILHHLKPSQRRLFLKYCYKSAKKGLIVCEPGIRNNFLNQKIEPFKKLVFELLEKDGVNQPKYRECFSKTKLKVEMENGFGVIPTLGKRNLKEIGQDLIMVYETTQPKVQT